jgi:toxin FitB
VVEFLLDTNVVSEARRAGGHPVVRSVVESLESWQLSVVTIGEVAKGIAMLPPGRRRDDFAAWLANIERSFAERILPVDRDIARRWGELTGQLSRVGRTISVEDGLIAATALVHGLTVLTRNTRDFEPTGVAVVDPVTLA